MGKKPRPAFMRRRRMPAVDQAEHQLQVTVAQFCEAALPPDVAWTSVDTSVAGGDGRAIKIQRDRKARGVKDGWPDTQFLWQSRFIAIELKVGDNGLQSNQERAREQIQRAGGFYHVGRSLDDVEAILRDHGMRLRCTAGAFRGVAP